MLKVERPALDIDRIPQYFNDKTDLIWLTQHCENDAYLAMRLVLQLMSIPLTKQLTNLAGNLWSRTMTGGRAERNEYLLLHEFHKAGYIVPDKASFGELASKDAAKAGKKDKKNIKEAAKKSATSNDNHGVQEARGDDDDDEEGIVGGCRAIVKIDFPRL